MKKGFKLLFSIMCSFGMIISAFVPIYADDEIDAGEETSVYRTHLTVLYKNYESDEAYSSFTKTFEVEDRINPVDYAQEELLNLPGLFEMDEEHSYTISGDSYDIDSENFFYVDGVEYNAKYVISIYVLEKEEEHPTSGDIGTIHWEVENNTLMITGTGSIPSFSEYGAPWNPVQQLYSCIMISDGITDIGDYAFAHSYGVEAVSVGIDVVSIGETAFYNCDNIETVYCAKNSCADSYFTSAEIQKVYYEWTSIRFEKDVYEVYLDEVFTLPLIGNVDIPEDAQIDWFSDDEDVIVVESGQLKAVGYGTSTITAVFNNLSATCEVEVSSADREMITIQYYNWTDDQLLTTVQTPVRVREDDSIVYNDKAGLIGDLSEYRVISIRDIVEDEDEYSVKIIVYKDGDAKNYKVSWVDDEYSYDDVVSIKYGDNYVERIRASIPNGFNYVDIDENDWTEENLPIRLEEYKAWGKWIFEIYSKPGIEKIEKENITFKYVYKDFATDDILKEVDGFEAVKITTYYTNGKKDVEYRFDDSYVDEIENGYDEVYRDYERLWEDEPGVYINEVTLHDSSSDITRLELYNFETNEYLGTAKCGHDEPWESKIPEGYVIRGMKYIDESSYRIFLVKGKIENLTMTINFVDWATETKLKKVNAPITFTTKEINGEEKEFYDSDKEWEYYEKYLPNGYRIIRDSESTKTSTGYSRNVYVANNTDKHYVTYTYVDGETNKFLLSKCVLTTWNNANQYIEKYVPAGYEEDFSVSESNYGYVIYVNKKSQEQEQEQVINTTLTINYYTVKNSNFILQKTKSGVPMSITYENSLPNYEFSYADTVMKPYEERTCQTPHLENGQYVVSVLLNDRDGWDYDEFKNKPQVDVIDFDSNELLFTVDTSQVIDDKGDWARNCFRGKVEKKNSFDNYFETKEQYEFVYGERDLFKGKIYVRRINEYKIPIQIKYYDWITKELLATKNVDRVCILNTDAQPNIEFNDIVRDNNPKKYEYTFDEDGWETEYETAIASCEFENDVYLINSYVGINMSLGYMKNINFKAFNNDGDLIFEKEIEMKSNASEIDFYVCANNELKDLGYYCSSFKIEDNEVLVSAAPIKYTIKFESNGATSGTMKNFVFQKGNTVTLPKNAFVKTYYDFAGWNTSKDGSGITYKNGADAEGLPVSHNGIIKLYAQWTLKKYKITYKLNGGTNNEGNPTTYTMKSNTITLLKPKKPGYIFGGWYTTSKYTTKVTSIPKGSKGSKTLYAKWTPIKYTIKYNGNGATSGKMAAMTSRSYGKTYTLTTNAFKRKGYIFKGWNTVKDGSGNAYANKAKVSNLTKTSGATVTLYAQWALTNYKITYVLNDGVNSEENPATYTYKSPTITFVNPTREGYTFKGWYTTSTFKTGTKITSISAKSTGSVKVYAKWSKNPVVVEPVEPAESTE